uniref:Nucleolin-like n=1 Tax=Heterorhabditis bacteriophora TaxID=37862 RepID=A0A1I7WIN3_HETBA
MEATDCEERQSEEHIASVSPVSPVSPEYSEAKLSAVLAKLHEDTTDRRLVYVIFLTCNLIDNDEEKGNSSPSKPRRILMDSDDNDSGPEDERDEKARSKRLLGSDISDSDEDGDRPRGEEEVGELMANIFGDDSDDDGGEEREGGPEGAEDADQHNYRERDDREDDPYFLLQFYIITANKNFI